MVWKNIKLPPFARQRPSRDAVKKMVLAGVAAAALVGAYCYGREQGQSEAAAHAAPAFNLSHIIQASEQTEHDRSVVAMVFGKIPVTRQELGDYLIDRFGMERIEFMVNRKIIDVACQAQKIIISDAEIKAQLDEDLRGFGCSERDFVSNILKRYNKTLYEWKEDVIRPKLALQHYVRGQISISEDDIRKGFEAKFGDKVECRMIVLSKEQAKDKYEIWNKINRNPEEFDHYAKSQFIQKLAADGGKLPPIHKHFGDKNIETEAFKLQPGEISPNIGMPDGTTVILQCVGRIPADGTRQLDRERESLHQELYALRVATEVPKVFNELRRQANPQVFLRQEAPPSAIPPANAAAPHLQMPSMPPVQAAQQPALQGPPLPPPSGN